MLAVMTEVTIISALLKLRLITALFAGQYEHLTTSCGGGGGGGGCALKPTAAISSGGAATLATGTKLHGEFLHWKWEFNQAERGEKPEGLGEGRGSKFLSLLDVIGGCEGSPLAFGRTNPTSPPPPQLWTDVTGNEDAARAQAASRACSHRGLFLSPALK